MKRFENKTVLITGATRGIGLSCAEQFAKQGARVFTVQRGSTSMFENISADFTDVCGCQAVIAKVIEKAGQLDVLVNNAGIMIQADAQEMSLEDWQKTLDVNLTVPFLLVKYALPYLILTKGAIVNVGSIEGLGSNPGHAAYCASKAGLHGLTRAIAVDHGGQGVRCNAVAPGWIDTELNEEFIESMDNPAQFREAIKSIHPIRRTGTPEDVAKLVTFLASQEASFITGQIYTIDGGRTSKLSLP